MKKNIDKCVEPKDKKEIYCKKLSDLKDIRGIIPFKDRYIIIYTQNGAYICKVEE